ncbi:MAG: sigma-54-dependent Fis family transcriptional regulator [Bacteroidales bacterium]|nr:sigma-54-dependent Fis family transcriptional regulator [Bacteroidales bacterium]
MNLDKIKAQFGIVGNDPKLNLAIENAVKAAPTDLSILVTGESGVGKDVFARLIHENSSRRQGRLVSVNCGSIPAGTIESELFGHVKGSFTGATSDHDGYFRVADGGTIFLDEVGEMPLAAQVKLLRVLENGEIIRVGEATPQKVDVRVVAATNSNMEKAVHDGAFRPDLYYRLNQMALYIPPLRERQNDIPMIFSRFAADIAVKSGREAILLVDDEARNYLKHYSWPGNVRELQNIVKRVAYLEDTNLITREILEHYIPNTPASSMPVRVSSGPSAISDRELLLQVISMGSALNEMRNEIMVLREAVAQLQQGGYVSPVAPHNAPIIDPHHDVHILTSHSPIEDHEDYTTVHDVEYHSDDDVEQLPLSLSEREEKAIVKALKIHHGNRKLAARDLGISERTLYRRIKDLGL